MNRFRSWLAIVILLASGFAVCLAADENEKPRLKIEPVRVWRTVFADHETELRFRIEAPKQATKGRIAWRLAAGNRTLAAREDDFTADPEKPAVVSVKLRIDALRDGVVLPTKLTLTAIEAGQNTPAATWEKDITIFVKDPFVDRSEWLKSLKITLFDPPGTTTKVLTAMKVPFDEQPNSAALADLKDGVLIVGEGVSFKEHRDVPELLAKVAARGVAVLCLAPLDGELVVPGIGAAAEEPVELVFHKNAIRRLDKRLDAEAWPPDGKIVAATVSVKSVDAVAVGEVTVGPGGWPWAEARYASGKGRWVFCGYVVIAKWDDGPTPRYLFSRMLEHLTTDADK